MDTNGDGKKDTDVVLGSYGLSVIDENSEAYIQTDCFENSCGYIADCLAFNSLASGYLKRWSITHGTYDKWRAMIELPSFKELTIASTRCQDENVDDNACVVPLENRAAETEYAGVPLTPTIWLINFMFLYKLNAKVAAKMPGYSAKLPSSVANGMIEAQANDAFGLPYQDTIDLLPGVTTLNQTYKQKNRADHQGDAIISPAKTVPGPPRGTTGATGFSNPTLCPDARALRLPNLCPSTDHQKWQIPTSCWIERPTA
ncbi:hypothetical protein N9U74_02175 [Synechococcus sp. AH-736-M02]|nr:hypothetical protein [Synechococcus sp. AH-736-M02]